LILFYGVDNTRKLVRHYVTVGDVVRCDVRHNEYISNTSQLQTSMSEYISVRFFTDLRQTCMRNDKLCADKMYRFVVGLRPTLLSDKMRNS